MTPPADSAPRELPQCPSYIAHPQSVWFETHWRAAYDHLKAERDTLREIIDHKSKTIGAMDSVLIQCGVNFDFDKLHGEQSKYLLHERDALQARVAKLRAALEHYDHRHYCSVCGNACMGDNTAGKALAADKGKTP